MRFAKGTVERVPSAKNTSRFATADCENAISPVTPKWSLRCVCEAVAIATTVSVAVYVTFGEYVNESSLIASGSPVRVSSNLILADRGGGVTTSSAATTEAITAQPMIVVASNPRLIGPRTDRSTGTEPGPPCRGTTQRRNDPRPTCP